MPFALGIVLLALLFTTWIYTVYVSWRASEGMTLHPITEDAIAGRWAVIERLLRRGWYGAGLETKQALKWTGKQAESAVVTVFPKSAPAFAKKDELTGLTQGPSSYFLKSISSDPQKTSGKRLPQTKKVV